MNKLNKVLAVLGPVLFGIACANFVIQPARADDRSTDRIVRALEKIASALENPKCR